MSCTILTTDTLFRRHRPTRRPMPPTRACHRGAGVAAHLWDAGFLETGSPTSVLEFARKDRCYTEFPQWPYSCGPASGLSLPAGGSKEPPALIPAEAFA